MTNNLHKVLPENPLRVKIYRESELFYWSSLFEISELELITAVGKVGHHTESVKKYLQLS